MVVVMRDKFNLKKEYGESMECYFQSDFFAKEKKYMHWKGFVLDESFVKGALVGYASRTLPEGTRFEIRLIGTQPNLKIYSWYYHPDFMKLKRWFVPKNKKYEGYYILARLIA